ncbi:MAG: hypothetical protein LPK58_06050 [Gammaproteobacteria bacterium]|nr:hypothetical protein [Gammaproteobacteria bacterium]
MRLGQEVQALPRQAELIEAFVPAAVCGRASIVLVL